MRPSWSAARRSSHPEGVQVALRFLFFHQPLCGPLTNSRFHHRPDVRHQPDSKLEAAYHRADKAINRSSTCLPPDGPRRDSSTLFVYDSPG